MFNHFDFLSSIYDRVMGPVHTNRLHDLLNLPADG